MRYGLGLSLSHCSSQRGLGVVLEGPVHWVEVFHLCTFGAVVTLPIYDILLKLIHFYYRRSLQADPSAHSVHICQHLWAPC